MPHWPKPWGRAAAAVEQLVIEQEFAPAGDQAARSYGITGWMILTLIQHASPDQVARWVARRSPGRDLVPAVQRARRRVRRRAASRRGRPG